MHCNEKRVKGSPFFESNDGCIYMLDLSQKIHSKVHTHAFIVLVALFMTGGVNEALGSEGNCYCKICHDTILISTPTPRHYVHGTIEISALAINIIGTLIILCGAIRSVWKLLTGKEREGVRSCLKEDVLLGLEVLIASEVISTVFVLIVPMDYKILWQRLGILVSVVTIRMALGYFFEKRNRGNIPSKRKSLLRRICG